MPLSALGVERPLYEIKADLFRALAHPVRIQILELLTNGELQVSELLDATEVEASYLSQHLAVLRRAGVVSSRRAGNAVFYQTADPAVGRTLEAAREFLIAALTNTTTTLAALRAP